MSVSVTGCSFKDIQNLGPSLWYNSEYINGLDGINPLNDEGVPILTNIVNPLVANAVNINKFTDSAKTIPCVDPLFKTGGINNRPYINFNGTTNYLGAFDIGSLWTSDVSVFYFFTSTNYGHYGLNISFSFTGGENGMTGINGNGAVYSYPNWLPTNTETSNFSLVTRRIQSSPCFGGFTKEVGVIYKQYNTLGLPNNIFTKLTTTTPSLSKYDISFGGRNNANWNDRATQMDLYDFIIFPRALTETEALHVIAYFKYKYNQ